ncbi:putative cold-shock DNA-binding protein [Micromonospora pisi]|uniref:Putative cold-shock DNA-binding protein n=1 Tax=Micromonospora pisi TaxID=589240 RepID=A0A495JR83_9ACTN|nr:cold shock domain-containing protein [Micromonospora pisi]RKR91145.1 putative cold-shock DNA-binding protein [Micromonospora pisi]
MIRGRFIRFDEVRGYGFITPDNGGEDVFVHANVLGDEKYAFAPGVPVEFEAVESDRGMKALAVRILKTERALASTVSVTLPESVPAASERSDDDGMCDVLTPAGFRHEVTELLLEAVPTLTGAQIVTLRQSLTVLAQRHGWVEN